MKRRNFIKLTSTVTAIGLLPFELKSMLSAIDLADCNISNRKLILINLAGGNDGLNTVIPINMYDTYSNLRPNLKVSNSGSNAYISLDSSLGEQQSVGLHPALTGFKSLYDKGWLRILQSVGYPSHNKSHFASTDIMSTGNDGNNWLNGNDSGWMGRFMELYYENELKEKHPLGIQIGSNKTSLGFHGIEEHGLAINITGQDPSGFYTKLNGLGGNPPTNIPDSDFGTELKYIINTDVLSNQYSEAISNAFNTGNNAATYPDTDISDQLKTVARLISGGLDSKIYMVRIGGFDTHNNQNQGTNDHLGKHNDLLSKLSAAVETFFADLEAQTLANDIVGLTYSEFGRKAKENGNLGTDHGEIAPMFVFGKPINGGVSGNNVDLNEATSSNNYQIKTVQYDYRQAFGTLLQNFLGASDTVIDAAFFNYSINQSFTDVKINEILKSSYSVAENCYSDTYTNSDFDKQNNDTWLVYPNPFQNIFHIQSIEEITSAQYKIYNSQTQLVLQGTQNSINGKISIDASSLASAIYFIQIYADEKLETHKILKI